MAVDNCGIPYVRKHARRQPNGYSCGAAALRHGLLFYGIRVPLRRISKLARVTRRHGASPVKLTRAAMCLGARLAHVACITPAFFQSNLLAYSRLRIPVLCLTENWLHWVTVLHSNGRHVTYADSQRDGDPIIRRTTWREFRSLACKYWAPGETEFHLYPLLRTTA